MNLVEIFKKWGVSLSLLVLMLSLILSGCAGNTADTPAAEKGQPESKPTTFTNPLFSNGADPWLEYYQGNYYLTTTTWTSQLVMRKSPTLSGLATATPINIWSHTEFERCCNFWAFEFHRLKGPNGWRWYVMYTSGQDGTLDHQHLSVIESVGDDPLGPYEYKGSPMPNSWNIDGTYFEHKDKLYLLWSEWVGDEQLNFISEMSNPWTITGPRMVLTRPTYDWEQSGRKVTEGAEILKHNGKTFVIYSASFCDTPDYKLGQLELVGDDPMKPASWKKSTEPVFQTANGVYAPGHNGFFKSPDGTEDWIVYHGNSSPKHGCSATRSVRAQKFTWNADGTPNFGEPVAEGTPVVLPSGENGPLTTRVSGAEYQLVNRSSNQCLAKSGNQLNSACQGEAAQWVLDYTSDGYFRLAHNATGNFLGQCSADQLQITPWTNANCQEWKLEAQTDGWLRLVNRATQSALTAENCTTEQCDQWRAQPIGTVAIASVQSGKMLTAEDCTKNPTANLTQSEWRNDTCQQWTFQPTDAGYFEIQTDKGACLTVEKSAVVAGANISLNKCTGNNSQWRIDHLPNGTQRLVARHSQQIMDLAHCGLANGTNLAQAPALDTICQTFQLRAVE
ncbi:family 43 glycosylhydrolase [Cellvibrio sp. ARAG 10.3]|uniref:family 43 glycosylhydrolase n=1 Tax=Cellvibrio sp. ARAG 10.3 TaxID=3451358 RepID=UPI003F47FC1B